MLLSQPPTSLLNGASLFLDFDGTLVEVASRPDGVEVSTRLLGLLRGLQDRLHGRVALLSGRAAEELWELTRPLELPIGGSHGLEKLSSDGRLLSHPPNPGLADIINELSNLAAEHPGILIEPKPSGVAIHYRLAPDAERLCQAAAERAASAIGMELQHGKMVVELKPAGADKGTMLRSFMAEAPFQGTRPIFIGDDLTDEHGFEAAKDFGGCGILVGSMRPTSASYRIDGVTTVINWLEAACKAMA